MSKNNEKCSDSFRTSSVNRSLQALRILSAEAGLSSLKGPVMPDSALAALMASLMA